MNNLQKITIIVSCLVLSVLPGPAQTVTEKQTNGTAVPAVVTGVRPVSDTRRTRIGARPTRKAAGHGVSA
jgi:hypothetical protein